MTLSSYENSVAAINALNGTQLGGRTLQVELLQYLQHSNNLSGFIQVPTLASITSFLVPANLPNFLTRKGYSTCTG